MCERKKLYVLDRLEGEVAILIGERGEQMEKPGLIGREGDVYELLNGELVLQADERERRERHMRGKMDSLFKRRGQK